MNNTQINWLLIRQSTTKQKNNTNFYWLITDYSGFSGLEQSLLYLNLSEGLEGSMLGALLKVHKTAVKHLGLDLIRSLGFFLTVIARLIF